MLIRVLWGFGQTADRLEISRLRSSGEPVHGSIDAEDAIPATFEAMRCMGKIAGNVGRVGVKTPTSELRPLPADDKLSTDEKCVGFR